MREIKFRAWDTVTDEMITGIGITPESDLAIPYLINHCVGDPGGCAYYPESVIMQYTGLKDKNNVEIYEGDIYKRCFKDGGEINATYLQVEFNNGCFEGKEIHRDYWLEKAETGLILRRGILSSYEGSTSKVHKSNAVYWTEVIGNIYQHPQLLEVPHE